MQSLKKNLLVLSTVLALAGSVPFTAAMADDSKASKASTGTSTKGHLLEDDEEIRAVQTVKLSLQDAVLEALKSSPGKALEAEFEDEKNKYVYIVKIVQQDGKVVKVTVDAENGQIVHKK